MKTLTVFTPTYNRAYILPKLYKSLCEQECQDFTWLIVDDGSIDNTEELVNEWIADGVIDISYHKQQNGGKMRAHNLGTKICKTPLFVCVDSDDYMTADAIGDAIKFWHENYHNEDDICGLIAYRAMVEDGQEPRVVKRFPPIKACTMHDLFVKYGHAGETTIVFRTDVIKKYPFPEIEGEKFITEAYVYDQIDQSYSMLLFDNAMVVCEYRQDGYTQSRGNIYKIAPKGWAMYFNQQCALWAKIFTTKEKIKALTYYLVMAKLGGIQNAPAKANDKSYRLLLALMMRQYYYSKIKKLFNE